MDEHEIKNLKAKVALLEDIKHDDNMLKYTLKTVAKRLITLLREANGRKEDGEGIKDGVTLTPSEFDQLWNFVCLIENDNIAGLDRSAERYESGKQSKEEILKLL